MIDAGTDILRTAADQAGRAFSAQAALFDSHDERNPILHWMRGQINRHLSEFLSPASRILELNAGTGIDAIAFARNGHSVLATDVAEGMLRELQKKVKMLHLEKNISSLQCSFTDLDSIPDRKFDHVFSNFGGLNCIPALRPVTEQLPRLLASGGYVTFVIMPPVCPWEIMQIFKGNTAVAFRRFEKNGTPAVVEGHRFTSYYFTPGEVLRSFPPHFSLSKLRGLASISPPPYKDRFPFSHPRLYKLLTGVDERLSSFAPFNRWADHFIITMKYMP